MLQLQMIWNGIHISPIFELKLTGPLDSWGELYPHTQELQDELEKVQNSAARFVTRNYVYETGSMTGILGQLKCQGIPLEKGKW